MTNMEWISKPHANPKESNNLIEGQEKLGSAPLLFNDSHNSMNDVSWFEQNIKIHFRQQSIPP